MERGVVHGRRDSRSRSQCAALAALGTIGVIVIYALLNALYLYAMPVAELAGVKGSVFDVIGERILGARAGEVLAILALISLAAGINAWTFAGPRIYYAMARDGVFFPGCGAGASAVQDTSRVDCGAGVLDEPAHPDGQPRHALELHRVRDHALCGHRRRGGVRACARASRTRHDRIKTLGYPIAPAIFVAASLAIVVNAFYRNPGPSSARPSRHRVRHSAVSLADTTG